MTDTPDQPSLLDRIKAAMGTYTTIKQIDGWTVYRVADGAVVAGMTMLKEATAQDECADLNARAVIDAIVGMLRWEDDTCFFANAMVGYVRNNWGKWAAYSDAAVEWVPTESEARAAVEAAFRAALMGDGK